MQCRRARPSPGDRITPSRPVSTPRSTFGKAAFRGDTGLENRPAPPGRPNGAPPVGMCDRSSRIERSIQIGDAHHHRAKLIMLCKRPSAKQSLEPKSARAGAPFFTSINWAVGERGSRSGQQVPVSTKSPWRFTRNSAGIVPIEHQRAGTSDESTTSSQENRLRQNGQHSASQSAARRSGGLGRGRPETERRRRQAGQRPSQRGSPAPPTTRPSVRRRHECARPP